jgi:hypothetical protein
LQAIAAQVASSPREVAGTTTILGALAGRLLTPGGLAVEFARSLRQHHAAALLARVDATAADDTPEALPMATLTLPDGAMLSVAEASTQGIPDAARLPRRIEAAKAPRAPLRHDTDHDAPDGTPLGRAPAKPGGPPAGPRERAGRSAVSPPGG